MHEANPNEVSPMAYYGGMMDIFSTNLSHLIKILCTTMNEMFLVGCTHIANKYARCICE
jgi:hypothetical protein